MYFLLADFSTGGQQLYWKSTFHLMYSELKMLYVEYDGVACESFVERLYLRRV